VSGLVFTASTLAWTGGAWIQAQRVDRYGPTRFLLAGFATVIVGIVGFAAILMPTVPLVVGVVTWAITGLGMGLSYSTLSLVVLREAPPSEQGAATAGLQLSDVLGTSLGTGIGGALIAFGARSGSPGWVGLAGAFAVAIAVAFTGLTVTRRLSGSSRGRPVGVR
jgi:MFS family permease